MTVRCIKLEPRRSTVFFPMLRRFFVGAALPALIPPLAFSMTPILHAPDWPLALSEGHYHPALSAPGLI